MLNHIEAFLVSFVVMTVLDATWLIKIAPKFYKKHIGFILADKPVYWAAALFYILYIIGLTEFAVYPAWHEHWKVLRLLGFGALYGLVTYATYDLTNQATLKKWPVIVTTVDLIWGTLLTSVVAVSSLEILRAFIK